MEKFRSLTSRNIKVYFKDKSMFFTSLITPGILLVLYTSFLGGIFEDSFTSMFEGIVDVPGDLIDSMVASQILSSLLAVSCITVAFTSNLLMVTDRVGGQIKDITVSPVGKGTIALSYFTATLASTLIVNLVGLGLCLLNVMRSGWYYTAGDIIYLIVDVIVLTLFGCALASAVNFNLKTQGQVSAVGTIVSAGYGFICGAYMPISSFGTGLQKVLSFLPGTYGTSLIKEHAMGASFDELGSLGVPDQVIDIIKDSLDCNIYFSGDLVGMKAKWVIMIGAILVCLAIYVAENAMKKVK